MKKASAPRSPGRPKLDSNQQPLQELILKTAAAMFMEQGFESISLQQIAKACNITKASIYYYFPNKGELFTASLIGMLHSAHYHTGLFLAAEGPIKGKLIGIIEVKIRQSHNDMETMLREALAHLSEDQLTRIRDAEQAIHELVAQYFARAMEENQIRRGDPHLMAHAFTALAMLGNREHAAEPYQSTMEMAAAIIELFWEGIAPIHEPN
ncbi:MAG: TetR/AcrR family transcriptional regulator [Paenibacillus sp.]|uniref:Transcriptional regulator, TetR family n=1 Tax=Paenibacillus aquistagni TaxID=1852522 RepID=A0A1X7LXT7_9BACL|nr:TetR/AcrR family transcriptional regulator [Paenibacillus aquistagni]MBR2567626.1 TetR/AcrR family transcriptional regulator [Paenibacillus sp.]NMM55090.1 TetR/AcrR family transcriptional regulator [Paenibacillus aquistagni]SMG58661.1 transcriptional regulator, TetR family [Paenibacillus aquistagni]